MKWNEKFLEEVCHTALDVKSFEKRCSFVRKLSVMTGLIFSFLFGNLSAQVSSDWEKDTEIFNQFFSTHPKMPVDECIWKAALFFLNTPYEAGTLEGEESETLVVDLRSLDCMTLIENCLALGRCMQYPNPDPDYFERILRLIRYRNGNIDGYTSRLHYTSDWIFDNVRKEILEDITHALGGYKFKPEVSYMSQNSEKYTALSDNPEAVSEMRKIENEINGRNTYYYIPKKDIPAFQSGIKNGDIICFTTSIKGLDISHLGIAYWYKNQLTFIHASTTEGKVIVNPESLADYCTKIKTNTGIMVLRANNQIGDLQ